MIEPAKGARFFERQNVGRLLHDAEQFPGPRLIGTDFTQIGSRGETALHAGMDRGPRFGDGARDPLRLLAARLHHPKGDALGRAWTDARHLAQLRDQLAQGGRIFGSFQSGTNAFAAGAGSVAICRQSGSSRRMYHWRGRSGAPFSARARLNSAKASL